MEVSVSVCSYSPLIATRITCLQLVSKRPWLTTSCGNNAQRGSCLGLFPLKSAQGLSPVAWVLSPRKPQASGLRLWIFHAPREPVSTIILAISTAIWPIPRYTMQPYSCRPLVLRLAWQRWIFAMLIDWSPFTQLTTHFWEFRGTTGCLWIVKSHSGWYLSVIFSAIAEA